MNTGQNAVSTAEPTYLRVHVEVRHDADLLGGHRLHQAVDLRHVWLQILCLRPCKVTL